jgi:hypothetical protein
MRCQHPPPMNRKGRRASLAKKVFFSLLPLVILLLLSEAALRCVYFQYTAYSPLAMVSVYRGVSGRIKGAIASKYKKKYVGSWGALYSDEGKRVLDEFKGRYETCFRDLVMALQKAKTKIVVLYVPSTPPESTKFVSEKICREFFRYLTAKYNVDLLDATDLLRRHDWERVTLFPKDEHLSRFGNVLIASRLNKFIAKHQDFRSSTPYSNTRRVYGDLPPSTNKIWSIKPNMPYRVIVNKEGFRSSDDLAFPKTKQRILILGDSFTFGPYLPNHDTYPELLQEINPDLEVINAGVAGYTITDQHSLFVERAQFTSPDITVLQVLDNDLYGLFSFVLNEFDRHKRVHSPSPLEEVFLDKLAQ